MSRFLYAKLVAMLMRSHDTANNGDDNIIRVNAASAHNDALAEKEPSTLALQRAITGNILRQRGATSLDLRR